MLNLILITFAYFSSISASCELGKELTMNVTEEIKCNGYVVENYKVETEDGYILQVQRIPFGKNGSVSPFPILLMHGIGCDASSYVDKLDNSLAFHLADSGFDVWLGNVRGNKYSLEHRWISTDSREFWNYSMDDIARKDLPAVIAFILRITRKETMFYAGTSLGSVLGVMLLSSQPEWNSKIIGFLNILPVSRMTYNTWPLRPFFEPFVNLGLPDVIISRPIMNYYFPISWLYGASFRLFDMYEYLGYDPETSCPFPREDLVITHCRSGISMKAYVHFSQAVTKYLHYYNYGPGMNLLHYNSITPPIYNLSEITTSMALFVAENDASADLLDVALLIRDVQNVYEYYVHPYSMFSHHDMTRSNATMRPFVSAIAKIGSKMAKQLL